MALIRKTTSKPTRRPSERGSVILEASVVMPFLVLLIAGIADYGLVLYQYHLLTNATGEAVRQLIISRGFDDPRGAAVSQYAKWASSLKIADNQVTITVKDSSGTVKTCTDTATCKTAVESAAGGTGTVEVTYNCTMNFVPAMGNPCPLKAKLTGMIE